MAKLVLTVSPDYLSKRWGVWEVAREFIQNTLDAQDMGNEGAIKFSVRKGKGILVLENDGNIGRERLLLGSTSKAGDSRQRGEFGEGLKLAIAVGLRLGLEFKINAGDESWTPKIEFSKEFNADAIVIHTRKVANKGKVKVEISGFAPDDWEAIEQRVLALQELEDDEYIETFSGKILTADCYKATLFVKGLFVCVLEGFKYGYDLNNVELDRDRRLADRWSLDHRVRDVWKEAVSARVVQSTEIVKMLNSECAESTQVFGGTLYDHGGDDFYQGIADEWTEQHGENAVPVTSMQESIQAEQHGLKGIVVPKGLRNAVEKKLGEFGERVSRKEADISRRYSWTDLDRAEQDNILWVVKLFEKADPNFTLDNVVIVDYVGPKIMGTHQDFNNQVGIAKWVVASRRRLLRTMVHEIAHAKGGDGTVDHRDAQDKLYGDIILALNP